MNAGIVGPVADRIAQLAPDSVVIVVTNPVEMTQLTRIRTGFPSERVLGMAGVLDSARFCSLPSRSPGSAAPRKCVPTRWAATGRRW